MGFKCPICLEDFGRDKKKWKEHISTEHYKTGKLAVDLVEKVVGKNKEIKENIMEIKTTFGGPCIYKQGIMPDGSKTGKIQYNGQTKEELEIELLASVESGRDDVESFVDRVIR